MATATQVQATVDSLVTDGAKLHDIVHGDENAVVQTDNGPVKSIANLEREFVLDTAPFIELVYNARDAVKPMFGNGPPSNAVGVEGSIYTDISDPLNSVIYGPKTTTWGPGRSNTGAAGPAGNVAASLALLKAAPTTNRTMIAAYAGGVPFNWEVANAPYVADDVNVVKSDSAALSVGAWVREKADVITFTGGRSVADRLLDTISIKDKGALGAGADDTTAINAIIAAADGRRITGPRGPFTITAAIDKDLGPDFSDDIQLLVNGQVLFNTYAHRPMIWGEEHLHNLRTAIIDNVALHLIFLGDSTTEGGAWLPSPAFNVDQLILNAAKVDGIGSLTVENRGHGGKSTQDWVGTYINGDVAAGQAALNAMKRPVYIVRYGINDPFYGRTLRQFATDLRSGLQQIRTAHGSSIDIVLMAPNSTSDSPNGRDERWYEQVGRVYRRAARDFDAAFIDTYGLFQNSRSAAGHWMDNPFGDGRSIHPLANFNVLIMSKLYDLLFPSLLKMYFRRPQESAITLANGWINFGSGAKEASAFRDTAKRVSLSGIVKNGTAVADTVIGTLPDNMFPRAMEYFPVLSSATTAAAVYITTTGQVRAFGTVGAGYLSLSGINFLAA